MNQSESSVQETIFAKFMTTLMFLGYFMIIIGFIWYGVDSGNEMVFYMIFNVFVAGGIYFADTLRKKGKKSLSKLGNFAILLSFVFITYTIIPNNRSLFAFFGSLIWTGIIYYLSFEDFDSEEFKKTIESVKHSLSYITRFNPTILISLVTLFVFLIDTIEDDDTLLARLLGILFFLIAAVVFYWGITLRLVDPTHGNSQMFVGTVAMYLGVMLLYSSFISGGDGVQHTANVFLINLVLSLSLEAVTKFKIYGEDDSTKRIKYPHWHLILGDLCLFLLWEFIIISQNWDSYGVTTRTALYIAGTAISYLLAWRIPFLRKSFLVLGSVMLIVDTVDLSKYVWDIDGEQEVGNTFKAVSAVLVISNILTRKLRNLHFTKDTPALNIVKESPEIIVTALTIFISYIIHQSILAENWDEYSVIQQIFYFPLNVVPLLLIGFWFWELGFGKYGDILLILSEISMTIETFLVFDSADSEDWAFWGTFFGFILNFIVSIVIQKRWNQEMQLTNKFETLGPVQFFVVVLVMIFDVLPHWDTYSSGAVVTFLISIFSALYAFSHLNYIMKNRFFAVEIQSLASILLIPAGFWVFSLYDHKLTFLSSAITVLLVSIFLTIWTLALAYYEQDNLLGLGKTDATLVEIAKFLTKRQTMSGKIMPYFIMYHIGVFYYGVWAFLQTISVFVNWDLYNKQFLALVLLVASIGFYLKFWYGSKRKIILQRLGGVFLIASAYVEYNELNPINQDNILGLMLFNVILITLIDTCIWWFVAKKADKFPDLLSIGVNFLIYLTTAHIVVFSNWGSHSFGTRVAYCMLFYVVTLSAGLYFSLVRTRYRRLLMRFLDISSVELTIYFSVLYGETSLLEEDYDAFVSFFIPSLIVTAITVFVWHRTKDDFPVVEQRYSVFLPNYLVNKVIFIVFFIVQWITGVVSLSHDVQYWTLMVLGLVFSVSYLFFLDYLGTAWYSRSMLFFSILVVLSIASDYASTYHGRYPNDPNREIKDILMIPLPTAVFGWIVFYIVYRMNRDMFKQKYHEIFDGNLRGTHAPVMHERVPTLDSLELKEMNGSSSSEEGESASPSPGYLSRLAARLAPSRASIDTDYGVVGKNYFDLQYLIVSLLYTLIRIPALLLALIFTG